MKKHKKLFLLLCLLLVIISVFFFIRYNNSKNDVLYEIKVNNKFGFINKAGEEVIKPKYDRVETSNNFITACKKNNCDYINSKGKKLVEYDSNDPFYKPFYSNELITTTSDCNKYIDKNGKIILDLEKTGYLPVCGYEGECTDFSDDLLMVYYDNKKHIGFINKKGKLVVKTNLIWDIQKMDIPPVYNFSEGLAAVYIDGKWGFIDKTGKMIIKPKFESKFNNEYTELVFKNGLAKAQIDNKYGYINKSGKFVWSSVIDNLIPVQRDQNNSLYPIKIGEKYGYIDQNGKIIFKPQFQETKDFAEGLGAFKLNNKWGYVDSSGKVAIKPQFDDTDHFSEGLALVFKGKKWGYIDKRGKYVISPKFEMDGYEQEYNDIIYFNNRHFSNGLAAALLNSRWGYIDKTGKFVIKPQYLLAHPFYDEITVVTKEIENDINYNFTCYVIDKSGKKILDYSKLNFHNGVEGECSITYTDGMMPVYSFKHNSYGYIDKIGKFIKTKARIPNYDMWPVPFFEEGLAPYNDGYKVGFINKSGHLAIKPIFDSVDSFNEGLAAVCIDDKWGFINKAGQIVINPTFELTYPFKNGLAKAKQGNKEGYINKSGKFVWYQIIKEEKKPQPSYIKKVKVSTNSVNINDNNGINAYLKGFQKEILNNWTPMEDDVKREICLEVQINKNGRNVSSDNSVVIIKSSGSNEFDTEAIIALNDPFEPLPDRFKGKNITIKIDFIYIPKKPK